ncbi:hypothetical protein C8R45DRAFT_1149216 [Mycena sanguinolenta]|nr:hypothetical protein C8R45DRAFT_1149216 [Mycena sanguinolenta]
MRLTSLAVLFRLTGTLHFKFVLGVAVVNWRDPLLDTLDNRLYRRSDLTLFAENCTSRENSTFAAQWLRLLDIIVIGAINAVTGWCTPSRFPHSRDAEDVSSGVQNFSSTVGFDNAVVTEYLDGTKVTKMSWWPIKTNPPHSLALPDTFNEVCVVLIERMINTVPSTVTLADTIEPFDFKVWDTSFYPQGGSLAFLASLRVYLLVFRNREVMFKALYFNHRSSTPESTTATIFWKERTGRFCSPEGCSTSTTQLKSVAAFHHHFLNASIDLATSISHFWVEVNDNDGSASFIVDNNGLNYTVD